MIKFWSNTSDLLLRTYIIYGQTKTVWVLPQVKIFLSKDDYIFVSRNCDCVPLHVGTVDLIKERDVKIILENPVMCNAITDFRGGRQENHNQETHFG